MHFGIFNDLWIRRELIFNLAWSDLKIRYKNSILGFGWTVLEPLLMLSILYLVFTNIFKTNIENYALYLLIGIVLWNTFSRGTVMNTVSILNRSNIVTKIYFPREILIVSNTITAFLMMCFEFIVILIFFIWTMFLPSPISLAIFPILGLLFVITLGFSLLLSVLNVHYRDIGVIWNVILQAGFFASPIIYSFEQLPENIRQILWFNPIGQMIDAAHNLILYDTYPTNESIIYMIAASGIILLIGIIVFRRLNPNIVEYL